MENKTKNIFIFLLIVFAICIAWFLQTIIIYIIISIVLSLIGQPLVRLLSKIKYKKFQLSIGFCSLLSLLIMIAIIATLVSLFIPLAVEEARIISKINPTDILSTFQEPLNNLAYTLQKYQINYNSGASLQSTLATKISSVVGFSEVSSFASQIFSFTSGFIAAFFSISFITFFLMKDEKLISTIILLLTPAKHSVAIQNILRDTKLVLTRYFIGVLLDMAFVATLTAIALSVVGIQNALLIGLFAGILNVIPYIGPLLGAGFAIIIGVSSNLDLNFYTQLVPLIEKIASIFLIIQLIDALFFQPLVISNTVKAHPLEIFLVILSAGTLAGISGMIIAIPIYTIVRIIAKEFLNKFKIIQKLTANLEKSTEKNSN